MRAALTGSASQKRFYPFLIIFFFYALFIDGNLSREQTTGEGSGERRATPLLELSPAKELNSAHRQSSPVDNLLETADDSVQSSPLGVQDGTVWPLPQKIHYGKHNRTVARRGTSPLVAMHFSGESFSNREIGECDILEHAKNTYLNKWLVFPSLNNERNTGIIGLTLQIVIKLRKRCPVREQFPTSDMNEEYRLMVPQSGEIVLEAEEVWGALRGLETFSQLFFVQQNELYIRTATVHDWPEYSVRGILLDTSRHYLHHNVIHRQIDLAAQNKMNVLHWHIVDMESFPYVSTRFPNISRIGAFTPKHVYSPDVIEQILRHARLRGVRVIPEFDTPGHMASWRGAGILADCFEKNGRQVASSMLDPSRESTYEFLKEFITDVVDTFRDKYIHLGGDETSYWTIQCWARNPKIKAFMAERHFANITELENYYFNRLQSIVKNIFGEEASKRRMIFWQEVFDNNKPDTTAIVHNWYSHNDAERARDIKKAVERGFQVIVSSCWYLNLINYGADWRALSPTGLGKYYYCDPRAFQGTYEQKQLVIGGIATMWGEYLDGTNLEATLWPRASAVAERLWSAPDATKSADAAWPRLQEHRCRMISRGFRAEPVNGPDYCMSEWAEPFEF